MDKLTPEERSRNMSRIQSKDTKPEMIVRRALHALGFRYRLHGKDLPGKPDLVFPKHRAVIFVQGCFWHRHEGCRWARVPESHRDYWVPKLARNAERDALEREALLASGWRVLWIWECALKHKADREAIGEKAAAWLLSDSRSGEISAPASEALKAGSGTPS